MRVLELACGVLFVVGGLWAFLFPRKDFQLGRRIEFLGVRNTEEAELNSFGVLRHRVGALILLLSGVFFVVDSVLLLL